MLAAHLIAAVLAAQAMEQIAPPTSPAAAVATEQAHRNPGDASVAQLPADARAVRQPEPHAAVPHSPGGVDVVRTYESVLSPTTTPSDAASRELGPDTIARLAVEAGVADKPASLISVAPKGKR